MSSATSLHIQLIRWLLLPMMALVLASTALFYQLALQLSTTPYDQALRDVALVLQDRLHLSPEGIITLDLSAKGEAILLQDSRDQWFFAIYSVDNNLIGGHKGIPFPPHAPSVDVPIYYGGHYDSQSVRIIAVTSFVEDHKVTILAASTMHARNALIRDAIASLIVTVLVLLSLIMLWTNFGLRHALHPLIRLRDEVSRRSVIDLTPLPIKTVPLEVRPLVEEINALLARLEQAQDAQRRFIADAAHQLRTPLASLRAYADLAGREHSDPQALHHDLERLQTASERASRLIQQLLSLARSEPGAEVDMQRLDIRLDELIRQQAPEWLHRGGQRQQTLEFDVNPVHVRGDAFKLGELMENIVDNALRYTPSEGRIIIRTQVENDSAVFEVEDSGMGIPPAQRLEVFARFNRLPQAPEGGSGLGLAIVQCIAQLHQASVEIRDSRLDSGICLRIRFPLISQTV
jgi:two-component system sensor histidine kinase TctE